MRFPRIIFIFLPVDRSIFMCQSAIFALAEAVRRFDSTVIAINRPLCPLSTLLYKRHRMKELFGAARLERARENLYFYSPHYVLHDGLGNRFPGVTRANIAALRRSLRSAMNRIGIEEDRPIVWYYHPQQGYVTRVVDKSFNVFELKDSLTDIYGNQKRDADRLEETYRDRVDLLLCSADRLLEKYGSRYRNAERSYNGLDRSIYEALGNPNLEPESKIAAISRPRIGFSGIISRRLNLSIVTAIAQKKPEWNLVFAGKVVGDDIARALRQHNNIHCVGNFTQEELPAVVRGFDVGIMPYLYTEYFRCANPLKFYDYAAAGIRSVSSPMDELFNFDDRLARVVPEDVDAWVTAVEQAMSSDEDVYKIARETALKHTWQNLAIELTDRLSRYFE